MAYWSVGWAWGIATSWSAPVGLPRESDLYGPTVAAMLNCGQIDKRFECWIARPSKYLPLSPDICAATVNPAFSRPRLLKCAATSGRVETRARTYLRLPMALVTTRYTASGTMT